MSVENQRSIIIHNPGVEKNFIQISKADLQAASRILTPAQLIVYIDLCGNEEGFLKDYSPAYFKKNYGISKDTVQKTFHILEDKGFIVKKEGKFHFYRQPQKIEEENNTYMEKPYTYMEKPDRVYENSIYPIRKNLREIDNIEKDNIDINESLHSSLSVITTEVEITQEPIKRKKEKAKMFNF